MFYILYLFVVVRVIDSWMPFNDAPTPFWVKLAQRSTFEFDKKNCYLINDSATPPLLSFECVSFFLENVAYRERTTNSCTPL